MLIIPLNCLTKKMKKMFENDLKFIFNVLGLDFKDFEIFMIGQTFSTIDNKYYYNARDIRNFFNTKFVLISDKKDITFNKKN